MLRPLILCFAALCLAVLPSFASGLSATQTIERRTLVEAEDGTLVPVYVPAEQATPGDQVRYVMTYVNSGPEAADAVVLAVPVPSAIRYVENSATMADTTVAFSADGGKSFAPRGDLTVSVDGASRVALSEEITHVRWTFTKPIAPGRTGVLSFEGVLR